ncbi:MAG: TonB-dependent receptor [Myxococcota bacterium]
MVRPLPRRVDSAVRFAALSVLLLAKPAPADDAGNDTGTVVVEPDLAPAPAPGDADVIPVGDVLVTATRAEREALDVAGNVTVITREEIQQSGVLNLPDLLRREPGLFVTNSTSNLAGYTIDARGFNNGGGGGGNTLVQIDGRRVNEPDSDVADWALIPLDQIERIEIVRGAASALYGDNATGGVVNIRTRTGEGPLRATVKGRGGSWTTGGGSFSASGTVGAATGSLFVDGIKTDGYRDHSAFSATNYQGSVLWNFSDKVLAGVEGGYHRDSRELPGFLFEDEIAAEGRRWSSPRNADDESDVESGFVHGRLEAYPREDVVIRVQPSYRSRADEALLTFLGYGNLDTETDKLSGGVDAQVQIDIPLFGIPNRLVAGMEFLHDERDSVDTTLDLSGVSTGTTFTDSTRDVYAGFLQDEIELHETVLLAAGVRYDHADFDLRFRNPDAGSARSTPSFSIWSPRASLTWRPTSSVSVYASYTRGFRLPNLDEASPLLFPGGFESLPRIEAQRSHGGEIGAKLANRRIRAGLSLFWMPVKDEILFDPIFFESFNVDRVRHRGIELDFSIVLTEWLQLYGNYTFDDVEIVKDDNPVFDGARMPITPKHRGTVGVFLPLPRSLEFRANANFVGERILANDFGQGGSTLAPLDAYATLDLLLAWRPKIGERLGLALTLAVRNVNDEEFDDFGVRGGGGTRALYPAPTRTFEAGLELAYRQ